MQGVLLKIRLLLLLVLLFCNLNIIKSVYVDFVGLDFENAVVKDNVMQLFGMFYSYSFK